MMTQDDKIWVLNQIELIARRAAEKLDEIERQAFEKFADEITQATITLIDGPS